MKHVLRILAFTLLITFCLCGCSKKPAQSNSDSSEAEEIQISELTKKEASQFAKLKHQYFTIDNKPEKTVKKEEVKVAEDGSFFDDFNGGIDPKIWGLATKTWGGGNHGVIPDNVYYTEDGIVVLANNGDWYGGPLNQTNGDDGEGGKRTGACLVSQKQLGPGSYEVRMKVAPQMGACTAMWTFYWTNWDNHEIDIEIPADKQSFLNSQFVTWTTESDYVTKTKKPTFFHNDGEWHTYRFDWHTEPEKKVDFYVDDVFQVTINKEIPTQAGRLWLGVWFPNGWTGVPLFDTSYMLIDSFKYTAFDEEHEFKRNLSAYTKKDSYPSDPIQLPTNNFISNGDFEVASDAWTMTEGAEIVKNPDREDQMLRLYEGSSAEQKMISAVPDSDYLFTMLSAVHDGKVTLSVDYLSSVIGNNILSSESFDFDSSDFNVNQTNLHTPKECTVIRFKISSTGKTAYVDDVYLTQPNRNDFHILY